MYKLFACSMIIIGVTSNEAILLSQENTILGGDKITKTKCLIYGKEVTYKFYTPDSFLRKSLLKINE